MVVPEAKNVGHQGGYRLLPLFDAAHFGVSGLDVWHDTHHVDEPFVGLNATGADQPAYTVVWPAGTIWSTPARNSRWWPDGRARSPAT